MAVFRARAKDGDISQMITGSNKRGPDGGMRVYIGGKWLDPHASQTVINHSPDGFAWGYMGSGPAQLALAILLHYTNDVELSIRYYQRFKEEIIAPLPLEHFHLREGRVKKWIARVTGWEQPRVSKLRHKNAERPEQA